MKVTDVVKEVELEMEESQNQRDARVEQLWKRLDYQGKGALDWKGLQRGLRKIDHPLKNADDMLKNIIKVVDTDGDGKIQYEEFRVFVEAAERQLYMLFNSIDYDHNGRLDKNELQAAFQRAGLTIPSRRLNDFFSDIDQNKDGYISFDEWRDFLLFMPTKEATTTLRAVFTFYSDVVTLTSEGDSVVSDETLESIAQEVLEGSESPQSNLSSQIYSASSSDQQFVTEQETISPDELAENTKASHMDVSGSNPYIVITEGTGSMGALEGFTEPVTGLSPPISSGGLEIETASYNQKQVTEKKLMKSPFDPGYFIAGALAGGVSRTATAPLDRLKVYLLVNTGNNTNSALQAAKKGQPVLAAKNAGRPLFNAIKDLYKGGGLRGFFAGNGLNVVKIMPETAIRFGAYEAAKRTLAELEGHGDPLHINPASKFVAGGVAGMVAQFFVYPLDTLKFRLQSEYVLNGPRGNDLLKQVFRNMYAEGGATAAYRGVTMALVGMFPYSAIDMGTFEFLKTTYMKYQAKAKGIHEEDAQPSTFATGIMGATSGAFGATAVYPLNVLRTRLQTQGTSMHPQRYTGIWDVARKTIRNEGVRGLYKGLMPNLLKVAPALSITWMVYENAKTLMNLS